MFTGILKYFLETVKKNREQVQVVLYSQIEYSENFSQLSKYNVIISHLCRQGPVANESILIKSKIMDAESERYETTFQAADISLYLDI